MTISKLLQAQSTFGVGCTQGVWQSARQAALHFKGCTSQEDGPSLDSFQGPKHAGQPGKASPRLVGALPARKAAASCQCEDHLGIQEGLPVLGFSVGWWSNPFRGLEGLAGGHGQPS